MASYMTSSGFPALDGRCEIDNNFRCTSYTSNTLGAGKVRNLGSSLSLNFIVDFPGPGNIFVILATGGVAGFSGTASENPSERITDADEPWAASATAKQAVVGRS